MQFALSFSSGKNSILALHRMVMAGHEPVVLLVMYRVEESRSWTHGIPENVLQAIAGELGIPLICCRAGTQSYDRDMQRALLRAKDMGAEACVFGDIDILQHRLWGEEQCAAADIMPVMPLWGDNREALTQEVIELGYQCIIKSIRTSLLPMDILGKTLSKELLKEMEEHHVDPSGENGEYHTIVVDGPLFQYSVKLEQRDIVTIGEYTAIDLQLK